MFSFPFLLALVSSAPIIKTSFLVSEVVIKGPHNGFGGSQNTYHTVELGPAVGAANVFPNHKLSGRPQASVAIIGQKGLFNLKNVASPKTYLTPPEISIWVQNANDNYSPNVKPDLKLVMDCPPEYYRSSKTFKYQGAEFQLNYVCQEIRKTFQETTINLIPPNVAVGVPFAGGSL